MTMKHAFLTALGLYCAGVGLLGCSKSGNSEPLLEFSPNAYKGTGATMASSGGGAQATGGVSETGGADESGGTSETGGADESGGATETGGATESGGMPATGGGLTPGDVSAVTFAVTTVAQGGKYAPRNIVGIWVEDDSGNLVAILDRHAGQRARYLTALNEVVMSQGNLGLLTDATTSATLTSHQEHLVPWDLTDFDGNAAPPGDYVLRIECTDRDSTGINISVNFSTADGIGTIKVPDEQYFVGMSIELE